MRSFPLRPTIAACPSDAEGISTKPNPLGCPLYWSLMMLTDVTDPKASKAERRSASVTSKDMFPT
jgi:hypothetical protein